MRLAQKITATLAVLIAGPFLLAVGLVTHLLAGVCGLGYALAKVWTE